MAKLKITLTGLCALTPGGPKRGETTMNLNGPLQLVMPSSAPRKANGDPKYTIPVHLPVLIVRERNVHQQSPRRPDDEYEIPSGPSKGQKNAVFLLRRERLSFNSDAAGTIKYLQSAAGPGQEPTGSGDHGDVNWIADMREVWPAVASIQKDCLPVGGTTPAPPAVALQAIFGSGTLAASWPLNNPTLSRIVKFDPQKGAQLVHQKITRQTELERDIANASEVTINSVSVDTGQAVEDIVLRTYANEDLLITLGNVDLVDLRRLAMEEQSQAHFDADWDFELYYDILASVPSGALSVPVVQGGQGSHSNCPTLRV